MAKSRKVARKRKQDSGAKLSEGLLTGKKKAGKPKIAPFKPAAPKFRGKAIMNPKAVTATTGANRKPKKRSSKLGASRRKFQTRATR